jgi:hypothetical protein
MFRINPEITFGRFYYSDGVPCCPLAHVRCQLFPDRKGGVVDILEEELDVSSDYLWDFIDHVDQCTKQVEVIELTIEFCKENNIEHILDLEGTQLSQELRARESSRSK